MRTNATQYSTAHTQHKTLSHSTAIKNYAALLMHTRTIRALTMYTGDGTWYRTVRIKFPVARLFALAENVGLTMSNGGRGLFTVQHPPYTVLYSTVNVFLLFCMMCSTVLYLVYSSTVLYCSVKSVHSKRPVL